MIKKLSFDAVILADGSFPVSIFPLSILKSASYLACCDNAGKNYIEHGYIPDAIVGDGDSLPDDFKKKYNAICHQYSEQDDNDLTKATRFVTSIMREKGIETPKIAYLGCTGKREDHTIGNISLMVRYMEEFSIYPVMLTDYGYFIPARGNEEFPTFARQQISIFNFGCTILESEGLKWNSYNYSSWWQGTLNEATGEKIKFHSDGKYIVYFTYDPK